MTEPAQPAGTTYLSHLRGRRGAGGRVGWNVLVYGALLAAASVVGALLGPTWWWSFVVVGVSVMVGGGAFVADDVRQWRRGASGRPKGVA